MFYSVMIHTYLTKAGQDTNVNVPKQHFVKSGPTRPSLLDMTYRNCFGG